MSDRVFEAVAFVVLAVIVIYLMAGLIHDTFFMVVR